MHLVNGYIFAGCGKYIKRIRIDFTDKFSKVNRFPGFSANESANASTDVAWVRA